MDIWVILEGNEPKTALKSVLAVCEEMGISQRTGTRHSSTGVIKGKKGMRAVKVELQPMKARGNPLGLK